MSLRVSWLEANSHHCYQWYQGSICWSSNHCHFFSRDQRDHTCRNNRIWGWYKLLEFVSLDFDLPSLVSNIHRIIFYILYFIYFKEVLWSFTLHSAIYLSFLIGRSYWQGPSLSIIPYLQGLSLSIIPYWQGPRKLAKFQKAHPAPRTLGWCGRNGEEMLSKYFYSN